MAFLRNFRERQCVTTQHLNSLISGIPTGGWQFTFSNISHRNSKMPPTISSKLMLVTFRQPFTKLFSTALDAVITGDTGRSPGADPDILANTPIQRPTTPLTPFIAVPLPVYGLVQPYNIPSTSFGSLLPLYTRGEGPPPYRANLGLGPDTAPRSSRGSYILLYFRWKRTTNNVAFSGEIPQDH